MRRTLATLLAAISPWLLLSRVPYTADYRFYAAKGAAS
ncbi:MAG: hypothetical protein K0Q43_3540 [Ramlibacter sp.]|jgi:hypothetical protein|nr:hypothetical protein [Ramlibacter sp.]